MKATNPNTAATATAPTLIPTLNPVVWATGVCTTVPFPDALGVAVGWVKEVLDIPLADVVFEALVFEVVNPPVEVVLVVPEADVEVTKPVLVLWRPLTPIIV